MFKKFIFLFVTLFFSTSIFRAHELSIHDYLDNVKLQAKGDNELKGVTQKSLQLLTSIQSQLKAGAFSYNPKIAYKFHKICQFLDEVHEIRIRDLRLLREEVVSFDNYLSGYKKNVSSKTDLALIEDIREFNYLLSSCLLDKDFLNSSIFDNFSDFIYKHKLLIGSTVICVVTLVSSYFIYDYWKKQSKDKTLDGNFKTERGFRKDSLENRNSKYDVKQFKATGQKGLECGLHAIKNCLALNSSDDEVVIAKLLVDNNFSDEILDNGRGFLLELRKAGFERQIPLKDRSIADFRAQLKENKKLTDKERKNIDSKILEREREKTEMEKTLKNIERYGIVAGSSITGNLANDEIERVLKGYSLEQESLCKLNLEDVSVGYQEKNRERFRRGHAQTLVIFEPGHWIAAKLIPADTESEDLRPRVIVANSISSNVTNSASLNKVVHWYMEQE